MIYHYEERTNTVRNKADLDSSRQNLKLSFILTIALFRTV